MKTTSDWTITMFCRLTLYIQPFSTCFQDPEPCQTITLMLQTADVDNKFLICAVLNPSNPLNDTIEHTLYLTFMRARYLNRTAEPRLSTYNTPIGRSDLTSYLGIILITTKNKISNSAPSAQFGLSNLVIPFVGIVKSAVSIRLDNICATIEPPACRFLLSITASTGHIYLAVHISCAHSRPVLSGIFFHVRTLQTQYAYSYSHFNFVCQEEPELSKHKIVHSSHTS